MRTLVLAALLCSSTATAQGLPDSEHTDETVRWLAVGFIAEAGWADPKHAKAEKDHRAIFHVLRRRWPVMQKRRPDRYAHFVNVVQGYVAAFDPRTEKGQRVRWLLSLQGRDPDAEPAGWPRDKANWNVHRVWWRQALERAENCIRGRRCRDPYPRAWHWGGDMDVPKRCMVELPNVGTFNTFYGLDHDCRRDAIRRRARQRAKRRAS